MARMSVLQAVVLSLLVTCISANAHDGSTSDPSIVGGAAFGVVICIALGMIFWASGCGCLSSGDDENEPVIQRNADTPLLSDQRVPVKSGSQAKIRAAKIDAAATAAAERLSTNVGYKSAGDNVTGKGPRSAPRLFCQCGGPGTIVQLVPCGCRSLCLMCAQTEEACPDCGKGIRDSVPSFKATM